MTESNRQLLNQENDVFATCARIKYFDVVLNHGWMSMPSIGCRGTSQ